MVRINCQCHHHKFDFQISILCHGQTNWHFGSFCGHWQVIIWQIKAKNLKMIGKKIKFVCKLLICLLPKHSQKKIYLLEPDIFFGVPWYCFLDTYYIPNVITEIPKIPLSSLAFEMENIFILSGFSACNPIVPWTTKSGRGPIWHRLEQLPSN